MEPTYILLITGGLLMGWGVTVLYQIITKRSTKKMCDLLIQNSKKEAEIEKKKLLIQGKEQLMRQQRQMENEQQKIRRRDERLRVKLTGLQKRYHQKLEELSMEQEEIEREERELLALKKKHETLVQNLNGIITEQNNKLVKIAGITLDEAKNILMKNLRESALFESAQIIKEIKDEAKENATREAKKIIALAIQRCAADHTAESTISVVNLPDNEMKGKIIGREGRNIRAFEAATGIEVIIDDTPEAVILSGFDPIKREVARLSLEELISGGKIHPELIEQTIKRKRADVNEQMLRTAREILKELKIKNLHPDLVALLGKLKYRTSFGQNVLLHSKEVALFTGLMVAELDLDIPRELVVRAGLLHDIGKAIDRDMEGTHTEIGYEKAKQYGQEDMVLEAIRGHHGDIENTSILTPLVTAADAISGSRPGARREIFESYIKRLSKLEDIADSFNGVEKAYALQAGREIRVIIRPETLSEAACEVLASEIAGKIAEEMEYPGQIKVTVIREVKSVAYAK